jgi:group I intron endonuclease
MQQIDTSCENELLDTPEKVFGIIYEITNTATGMKYVGQTVSHRLNKGKYRPFGMIGRFNDHISEAINNTKKKQCSFLNNAIRKYGKESFIVEILERCPISTLNEREQFYITNKGTLSPEGYNLTQGGKTFYVCTIPNVVNVPKKRGGCSFRGNETRAKMSARQKQLLCAELSNIRRQSAKNQHNILKIQRFNGCIVDIDMIDTYIRIKGRAVIVSIDGKTASFTSKYETIQQSKERAIAFIKDIHNATLPNCGKSVKDE